MKSSQRRNWLKEWRARQKAAGLCLDCKRPVAISLRGKLGVMCEVHRRQHSKRTRTKRWADGHKPQPLFSLDSFSKASPIVRAYAAALIDGEGHISIDMRCGRYSPIISVGMTDIEPVRFMRDSFLGSVCLHKTKRNNRKPSYHWNAQGRRAAAIAKVILPYLKIPSKIAWAKLMIEYGKTIGLMNRWRVRTNRCVLERQNQLRQQIRALAFSQKHRLMMVKSGTPYEIMSV